MRRIAPTNSISIKDTTREDREEIIRMALDRGVGGCENCSSCALGGGDPYTMYQPYIDGEKEITEINAKMRQKKTTFSILPKGPKTPIPSDFVPIMRWI